MILRNENKKIKIEMPREISAGSVSKYLLYLDPNREYFSKNHLLISDKNDGYKSNPTIGNFRLNKMLQIIQALYFGCYKQLLFTDKMMAFEHGGIVHSIYSNFMTLHREDNYIPTLLVEKQKDFIEKIFSYLKDNYSDKELRELAHEDIAGQKAWNSKKTKEFEYDTEALRYYEILSSSLLRAMGLLGEMDC